MTTVIIPHFLSIFRFLVRPRLLTHVSTLPVGGHWCSRGPQYR
jgi:hypothetical protein